MTIAAAMSRDPREKAGDMIPLLLRHEIQVLLRAGHAQADVVQRVRVSTRTIRGVLAEDAVSYSSDTATTRYEWQSDGPSRVASSRWLSSVVGFPAASENLIGHASRSERPSQVARTACSCPHRFVARAQKAARRELRSRTVPEATSPHVLHDADLAEAIVDRILERARLLGLDGPSVRTKHLSEDELGASEYTEQERAKVSGTHNFEHARQKSARTVMRAPQPPHRRLTRVIRSFARGVSVSIRVVVTRSSGWQSHTPTV